MSAPQPGHARTTNGLVLVHRVGAIVLGLVLWVFGILGLISQLGFFNTTGEPVLGLSSNGLLSLVSLVVGAVLIGSGIRGGRTASTVTAVVGGLFLLSGLANLAVLDTSANLLAFTIRNVFFSLVVGLILLVLGLYGRVSGGLPDDNPYRRERQGRTNDLDHAEAERIDQIDEMSRAEQLVAEGLASPEQEAAVARSQQQLAQRQYDEAWAHARRTGQAPTAGPGSSSTPS